MAEEEPSAETEAVPKDDVSTDFENNPGTSMSPSASPTRLKRRDAIDNQPVEDDQASGVGNEFTLPSLSPLKISTLDEGLPLIIQESLFEPPYEETSLHIPAEAMADDEPAFQPNEEKARPLLAKRRGGTRRRRCTRVKKEPVDPEDRLPIHHAVIRRIVIKQETTDEVAPARKQSRKPPRERGERVCTRCSDPSVYYLVDCERRCGTRYPYQHL